MLVIVGTLWLVACMPSFLLLGVVTAILAGPTVVLVWAVVQYHRPDLDATPSIATAPSTGADPRR